MTKNEKFHIEQIVSLVKTCTTCGQFASHDLYMKSHSNSEGSVVQNPQSQSIPLGEYPLKPTK